MNNTNLPKVLIVSFISLFLAPILSTAAGTGLLSYSLPSAVPNYNEVYVQGVGSTLYVNTDLTGKVVVAREIKPDKSLGKKYYFDFNQISDSWAEMVFDNPVTGFNEIILLGTRGNVLLKKSAPGQDILVYANGTSSGTIVSRLGFINGTVYFPDSELLDIDSIGVSLQKPDGEKIKGSVVVATDRTVAFQFRGVNSNYINDGKSNLIIRLRSKSISLNIDSWGYTFDVERVEPNTVNLVSTVFGLDPERTLNVSYEAYEGQEIRPLSSSYTVKEINSGKPLAVVKDDNKPIKFDLVLPN